jgi:anti-anti-sigma regulatory factor
LAASQPPSLPDQPVSPLEPNTIVVALGGRVAPDDARELCARLRGLLLETGAARVVCEVGGLIDPDACTVNALARLALTSRRLGCVISLADASPRLLELVALCGLGDVLPVASDQSSSRTGSPNNGKNFAVSRKNVIPLMRPPDVSTT